MLETIYSDEGPSITGFDEEFTALSFRALFPADPESLLGRYEESLSRVDVTVCPEMDAGDEQANAMHAEVAAMPEVASVDLATEEEALARFKEWFSDKPEVDRVKIASERVFPNSDYLRFSLGLCFASKDWRCRGVGRKDQAPRTPRWCPVGAGVSAADSLRALRWLRRHRGCRSADPAIARRSDRPTDRVAGGRMAERGPGRS